MKVLVPIFYDDFKCSANKCTYTCCTDWEILVDKNTYHKYEELGLTVCHKEDIMGISCYYARIIEHRSLQQIIKIIEEIGDGEWFQPGNLFTLIR